MCAADMTRSGFSCPAKSVAGCMHTDSIEGCLFGLHACRHACTQACMHAGIHGMYASMHDMKNYTEYDYYWIWI